MRLRSLSLLMAYPRIEKTKLSYGKTMANDNVRVAAPLFVVCRSNRAGAKTMAQARENVTTGFIEKVCHGSQGCTHVAYCTC